MKGEEFLKKLETTDSKLVEAADRQQKRRVINTRRILILVACIALISVIAVFALPSMLTKPADASELGESSVGGELSESTVSGELAEVHEMPFSFFCPDEGGIKVERREIKLGEDSKTENLFAVFAEKCGITDTDFVSVKSNTTGERDEVSGGVATHYTGIKTVTLELSGNLPDELVLKCLVNSVLSWENAKYAIITVNGSPISIGGATPSGGFGMFEYN